MERIKKLSGTTVGIDTAPLIYFIEEKPPYLSVLEPFFAEMEKGSFLVSTSTITLLEVLVYPMRAGNYSLASEYKDILLHSKMITVEISHSISERAAGLRAKHNIRTPDALQICAAIETGADYFLSNDLRLPDIPSIKIITLDSLI
ncbi:PilT protein domain protein [Desulfonatronospira thiodismutans ASO3-1]|uniref:PilT protein domain protein n=2 Tax=Desulfonatronospira TaxID=488937 RepID=D6SRU1_9BACT|nr:PIN domain-containing protein [Desulfonatronospira thiodismutans]EFI33407.1 PilT protein domain protein [Desulfonatronospira thiodismutans ASO3-1]